MSIQSIVKALSSVRLSTYKNNNLCDASDEQSLGLYLWNKQLSGHFLPILQILEVSLRNAIHNAYIEDKYTEIEQNVPEADWEQQKSDAELWFTNIYTFQNNRTGYNQVRNAKRLLENDNKPLTADNYISKLMLGFWVNMTNPTHRSNTNQSIIELWPQLTEKVFPNAVDKHGSRLSINNISQNLHDINELRNRIAHHEPIWKASNIFDTDDAVNNIVAHYERCLKVIRWINLDNLKLISIIENDKLMGDVCNRQTLWKNKQLPTGLISIPEIGDWSKAHKLDTRRSGTVIVAQPNMALVRCDSSGTTFYTNRTMQKRKASWPLAVNDKVNFIPKPSASQHPHATQVKC